jgi:2-polyprenyl-3-methyl-5-hydroxy-6-metoxy-1,4-benzoquinol methylase
MNTLKCILCNALIPKDEYLLDYYISDYYRLYHCFNCGIEFWHPFKMPSVDFYEDYSKCYSMLLTPSHKKFFKYFNYIKGSLIDVGCGAGVFVEYAQKRGFDAHGIDFNKNWIIAAKKRGVKNLYSTSLELFTNKKKLFDIITFFEVLEHQNNPKKFIEDIKKLLKQGGYIAGSVPNRQRRSSVTEFIEKKEFTDAPPHHFTWWDKESLLYFLKSNGFTAEAFIADSIINYMPQFEKRFKKVVKKAFSIETTIPLKQTKEKSSFTEGNELRGKSYFLIVLRLIRLLLLGPIALPKYIHTVSNNSGMNIYFQAKLV